MPQSTATIAPKTPDELNQLAMLAGEFAGLDPWTTLTATPDKTYLERRIKVGLDKAAIARAIAKFSPRHYRFTAARFADASLVICVTPIEAPDAGETATEHAKGK